MIHNFGVGQERGQISRIVTDSLTVMHLMIILCGRIIEIKSSVTTRLSLRLFRLLPIQIGTVWLALGVHDSRLQHLVAVTRLAAQVALLLPFLPSTVTRRVGGHWLLADRGLSK